MKPVRDGSNRGLALVKSIAAMRNTKAFLGIGIAVVLAWSAIQCRVGNGHYAFAQSRTDSAAITVDYPEDGSIFPPGITPPTFIWHDESTAAAVWTIDVSFSDGSPAIHFQSPGARPRIGEIDPRCVSLSNELPALTPRQATAHTWTPTAEAWQAIKQHSKEHAATFTITGIQTGHPGAVVSRGTVTIETSKDSVSAPIFYRDVPLIPSKGEKGVIPAAGQTGSASPCLAPARYRPTH